MPQRAGRVKSGPDAQVHDRLAAPGSVAPYRAGSCHRRDAVNPSLKARARRPCRATPGCDRTLPGTTRKLRRTSSRVDGYPSVRGA